MVATLGGYHATLRARWILLSHLDLCHLCHLFTYIYVVIRHTLSSSLESAQKVA